MNDDTRELVRCFNADAAQRCQALADEAVERDDEAAAEHWRQMVSMHTQRASSSKPIGA